MSQTVQLDEVERAFLRTLARVLAPALLREKLAEMRAELLAQKRTAAKLHEVPAEIHALAEERLRKMGHE